MDLGAILLTVLGIFLGAVVTWWVAKRYYEKATLDLNRAAQDLRIETQRARHVVNTLARYLDTWNVIDAEWNTEGDLIGVQPVTLTATQAQSVSLAIEVIRASIFDPEA